MPLFKIAAICSLSVATLISGAPTQDGWRGRPHHSGPPHRPHRPHGYGDGEPVTTTVDLGYSQYEGYTSQGVNQWLGMRFAAPPIGDLRWRAPQPAPVNNSEVLPADQFGATCLGYWASELSDIVNEDCLYINVFTPENATTESKLPVWFFIQGGGYAGDLDQNFNATEVIMKSNYSMVFVQINYRVGAFGFLASEQIRENGDLNVGLLDQRFALQWAQQYIHLFGGDKDHVVITGDSAGAGSVAFQMTAYGGRDDHLFVGGIAESSFWPTHRTVAEMEFQFDRFAANVSCSAEDAPDDDVLACLRSKDTLTLQSADYAQAFPGRTEAAYWYFLPVVDIEQRTLRHHYVKGYLPDVVDNTKVVYIDASGRPVVRRVEALMKPYTPRYHYSIVDGNFSVDYLYNQFEDGRVVPVPLLVGDDTDEGTGFVPNATNSSQFLSFMQDNFPKLSAADLQRISEAYPEDGFADFPMHADYFAAVAQAYGENTFVCPGIEMSNSISAWLSPARVWNYRYNVQDIPTVQAGLGVPHVSEKPAIYGVNNTGTSVCNDCSYATYNAPIIPIVMDYWISFIISLNPNTYKNPSAPIWDAWLPKGAGYGSATQPQRLELQLNATAMELVPSAQLGRCDLWKSLANVTEQ